ALFALSTVTAASANPLEALRKAASGEGETLKRLPNDNVEGTVWEYKGVLEKGTLDDGEPFDRDNPPKIDGMFRLEQEAVFAVGASIKLPTPGEVKQKVDRLIAGRPDPIRLPTGKPRRIGEFTITRTGRLNLKFDEDKEEHPDGLYGTMAIRMKKGQTSVWIGDYREKEGKRTVRTWQMTLRKIQD
ncbi:MAG: hypothetical protein AAGG46_07410, partial [Planctomycetota bacterium]